jgi:uncharacterized membrane protein (DUF373 family)
VRARERSIAGPEEDMTTRKDPESGVTAEPKPAGVLRLHIARGFTLVEDVVYVCLGILLALSAGALVVGGAAAFWESLRAGAPVAQIVNVLDRILLVLMIIELLYTVKVSFREHALVPEPFLIVGLIAATRRILIVTAQFAVFLEKNAEETAFRHAMLELALLTVMVVALVGSLLMLRKRSATSMADHSVN